MTRNQIIILFALGLIACIVLVGLGGVLFQIRSAPQPVAQQPTVAIPQASTPSSTPTETPLPTVTPTPTDTAEPTPTSTLVVGVTFTPSPTAPVKINLIKPTVKKPSPTAPGIGSSNVSFWADSLTLQKGNCTVLHWNVENVSAYWIDGEPGAGPTGSKSVCPNDNKIYVLKYDENVNGLLRSEDLVVEIRVYESTNNNSDGGSSGGSGTVIATYTGYSGMQYVDFLFGVDIYDNNEAVVWVSTLCGIMEETVGYDGNKIVVHHNVNNGLERFDAEITNHGNSLDGYFTNISHNRGRCTDGTSRPGNVKMYLQ